MTLESLPSAEPWQKVPPIEEEQLLPLFARAPNAKPAVTSTIAELSDSISVEMVSSRLGAEGGAGGNGGDGGSAGGGGEGIGGGSGGGE